MIERVTDYRRVRKLVDENPAEGLGKWQLVISSEYYYLVETFYIDGQPNDLGVWCFEPDDTEPGTYFMHAAMGPQSRGKRAVYSGLDAIEWMFAHTACNEVLAPVPTHLRHAQRIPRAAGLDFVGIRGDAKVYRMTKHQFLDMKESA